MKLSEYQIKKIISIIDEKLESYIDKIYQSNNNEYVITFNTEDFKMETLNNYLLKININELFHRY